MEVGKYIFIIVAPELTIEEVRKDLKEEGYRHHFYFSDGKTDFLKETIDASDEIWCFGNCDDKIEYKLAKEMGADIWKMK